MITPASLLPSTDRHAQQVRPLHAHASGTAYCVNCSAPYPAALADCPECAREVPVVASGPDIVGRVFTLLAPALAVLGFFLLWGFGGGMVAEDRSLHGPALLGFASSILLCFSAAAHLPGGWRAWAHGGRMELL